MRCHWKSVQASCSSHLPVNPVERISGDAVLWSWGEEQLEAELIFLLYKAFKFTAEIVDPCL